MAKIQIKNGELINAKINFISLVDSAANKRKFIVCKSANGGKTFTSEVKIIKSDEEKGLTRLYISAE